MVAQMIPPRTRVMLAMTERRQTLGESCQNKPPNSLIRTSSKAGPGNSAPGVGGTAKDGGMSTAATVADGGPDDKKADPDYKP